MWCHFKIICFLMCLKIVKSDDVQPEKLQSFQESIGNITKVKSFEYQSLSIVTVQNVSSFVYFYNRINLDYAGKTFMNDEEPYRKSTRFYSCLNCKFANWLNEKLFQFVNHHPELYKIVAQPDKPYRAFIEKNPGDFQQHAVKTLNEIDEHTQIFISIIFNFLEVYTYVSLLDTSLLKSLVSLQLKTNDIRTFISAQKAFSNREELKKSVYLRILRSLNELQQFKALNCDKPSDILKNSRFFGYPQSDKDVSYERDMKKLLTDIEPITYLYKPNRLCNVNKMLLINVLTSDGPMSKETSQIDITLSGNSRTFTIREIQKQIIGTEDLEVVHWYQNIVYNSILKVLYTKLHFLYSSEHEYSYDTASKIVKSFETLDFLLDNVRLTPKPLIAYYKLMTQRTFDKVSLEEFKHYIENNYLGQTEVSGSDLPDVRLNYKPNYLDSPDLKPEELIRDMIDKLDDYRCFVHLLEFLTFEVLTHRTKNTEKARTFITEKLNEINPNVSPSDASKFPDDDRKLIDRGCDLVYTVYKNCFETIVALNGRDENYPLNDSVFKNYLATNVHGIVSYSNLFDATYDWDPLKKISSDMVQAWVLLDDWLTWNESRSELTRFFYLVLTEFDAFGVEFCAYNYLTFDKENPETAAGRQDLKALVENGGLNLADLTAAPPIKILVRLMERKAQFVDSYGDAISVYWKGERKSMVDVYRSLTLMVSSPYYMYAVLDVYLKFAIAVFYYETNVLFARYCYFSTSQGAQEDPSAMLERLRTLKSKRLPTDRFPKRYWGLVNDYNSFFERKFAEAETNYGSDPELVLLQCTFKIGDESVALLNRFGVFVETDKGRKSYGENVEGIFLKRRYPRDGYSLTFKGTRDDYSLESDIRVFNGATDGLLDDLKKLNVTT